MHKTKDAEIDKPRVAFICVHNSCRSQIAEALGKHLASDVFESYSAGTETKNRINPDAVRIIKQLYGIDMEETQHPKLLEEIKYVKFRTFQKGHAPRLTWQNRFSKTTDQEKGVTSLKEIIQLHEGVIKDELNE